VLTEKFTCITEQKTHYECSSTYKVIENLLLLVAPLFISGCLLHLVNPAPVALIALTVCCQRPEDYTVAEKEADSVPTGDILSSQTQTLTIWKNTVVLWAGGDLIERSEPVLFQASSSAGKIPRMQETHTSFFSGKGFGFALAINCLINTIVLSNDFIWKDAT